MSLFIDLTTIRKNIKIIKEKTNKEIIVVIKSNAYGLGCNKIIKTLYQEDIRWYAFNTTREYLNWYNENNNKEYKHMNILFLSSVSPSFYNKYHQSSFRYTINSKEDILTFINTKQKTYLHLQIDTGMNRLGIKTLDEFQQIMLLLQINPNLIIEGLYTHYVGNNGERYQKQVDYFQKFTEDYHFKIIHTTSTKNLNQPIIGNMVRIGIGIYGYSCPLPVLPCISLYTKIINIISLEKDDIIGYDPGYKTDKKTRIGIIPYGYNEIQNKSYLTYRRQKIVFLGPSCMNHSHILLNDTINKDSYLSLLGKNDIIYINEYDLINWYHLLISIKTIPKNYISRDHYDIPSIFKPTNEKSNFLTTRKRSY